jgi:ATP-dependent DNA helicase HFM1/MER3
MVAQIGFLNNTAPLVYNRRSIYVCFLAETSEGDLVDFRRCSAKNLQRGEEFFLAVQITKPTSHLKCYVMCDEVAGTCKYAELHLVDIPESMYARQQDVHGTDNGVLSEDDNNGQPSRPQDDDFDDGGIADQDLLSVEATGSKIEVIEDIDEILKTRADKKHHKTSKPLGSIVVQAKHEVDDDTDVSNYREPVRLPNGRWTCQHDCVERNKDCKHKCCKEGAAKPKRRPKEEPRIKQEDRTQTKITSLTHTRQKVRTAGQETLVQDKLPNPAGKSDHAPQGVRKSSTSQPAAKRLKLSMGQTRMDTERGVSIKGENSEADAKFSSRGSKSSSLDEKKAKIPTESLDGPLFDFSDHSMDGSGCEEIAPGMYVPPKRTNSDASKPTGPEFAEFCSTDDISDDFLLSHVDLGGFEAPLQHVALSDVQKSGESLFITGNSSSPDRYRIQAEPAFEAREAFLESLVDFSECLVKDVEPEGSGNQTPAGEESAILSSDETSPGLMVSTPGHPIWQGDTNFAGLPASTMTVGETEEERGKRLYEEDQKKKWEGIDQWLYDEFHDYVEIV